MTGIFLIRKLHPIHCTVASYELQQQQPQANPIHIRAWWEEAARKVPSFERRRLNGVVIYTFWNIWKERNRRIFNNAIETVSQVATRIKEDIEQRKRAFAYV